MPCAKNKQISLEGVQRASCILVDTTANTSPELDPQRVQHNTEICGDGRTFIELYVACVNKTEGYKPYIVRLVQ